jgi:tetratricopeptide (TPR) repeat protein
MTPRILKTILIGFLSTGAFGSDCFDFDYFEKKPKDFSGFLSVKKDMEKNPAFQEASEDSPRILNFFRRKNEFENAILSNLQDPKLIGLIQKERAKYSTVLLVNETLKDLGIRNFHKQALIQKRAGRCQKSLEFFDKALGKFFPELFETPDWDTPESKFRRYKIKREKDKIYAQRWTLAINYARDIFLSPGFFFSNQSKEQERLATRLYKSILEELEKNTDQFSPLLASKEAHISFFFYMLGDTCRLDQWMGAVSGHPQSFGLTSEFDSLSQQALTYIAIINIVYKTMKVKKPVIIQNFLNRAHQQNPTLLKDFQKTWEESIEKVTENMKTDFRNLMNEGKREGQKVLKEGKIEESWGIYDHLIDQLLTSQTQIRPFEIENIEHIQDIKRHRWEIFAKHGAKMIEDSLENSSKSPVSPNVITIFNNILKEYETFPAKEKNDIYNGYVLVMFPYILFFYETGNYELIEKWIDCALGICENIDSSMWTQSYMESIIFISILWPKINSTQRRKRSQVLYDQLLIQGRQKGLEEYLQEFSKKVMGNPILHR